MNSLNITKDQARKIAGAHYPPTNYLVRLRNRMHERGFPTTIRTTGWCRGRRLLASSGWERYFLRASRM
jgi:hypothetical protein